MDSIRKAVAPASALQEPLGFCSLTGTHQNSYAKGQNTSTDAKESTDTDLCISVVRRNLLCSYQLTCPQDNSAMGPFSTHGGGLPGQAFHASLTSATASCLTHQHRDDGDATPREEAYM